MLDTNVYSALMRGERRVVQQVRRCTCVYLSATVVGELLYGFRRGHRYDRNREQLDSFLANPYVEFVPVTMATCERFAMVATALRGKGKPIPGNDIWIAAHTLETGADLLSFDAHFAAVEGLSLVRFGAG
jgi:tRNA(fMet)-specific endonuclease VapC